MKYIVFGNLVGMVIASFLSFIIGGLAPFAVLGKSSELKITGVLFLIFAVA